MTQQPDPHEPPSTLPLVDVHPRRVAAPRADAWRALCDVVDQAFGGGGPVRIASALGAYPAGSGGPRPLTVGFDVVEAYSPDRLVLRGSHRFSRNQLAFDLVAVDEATTITAETRAAFPGLLGRAYRIAVIDARLHVRAVQRLLDATDRLARRRAIGFGGDDR